MTRKPSTPIAGALLGLALAVFSIASPQASRADPAQGVSMAFNYTDFTTWSVYGSATALNTTPGNGFTYSLLTLTQNGSNGSVGAAFAPTPVAIDLNQAFSFDFYFFIAGNALRGDGLSFTLARAPGSGGTGSALGYEGIEHSVALAVDTFNFDDEPVSPSLQLLQNGSTQPLAVTETGLGDGIRNNWAQSLATLSFTPSGMGDATGTLNGSLLVYTQPDDPFSFNTYTVSAAVDLSSLLADGQSPGDAALLYYGFTAANGAASDGHFIASAMAVPVPEPGAGLMLLAGLATLGLLTVRRRPRS